MNFDPQSYGAAVAQLLENEPLPPLGPGSPQRAVKDQLAALDDASIFPGKQVVDHDMAACCRSALWLLFDFLDPSHTISQEVHTSTGSYWHGIMHRREPDYSNSKYWFRSVGTHPVFEPLCAEAAELAKADDVPEAKTLAGQAQWDAFAFVDLCQKAARSGGRLEMLCREIARAEWRLLFDYCYRHAVAG